MAYSEDLRKKVVAYIQNGSKISQAIKVFGVSRKSINRWLDQLETLKDLSHRKFLGMA